MADKVFALALCLLLSPIFLLIAIAIKLDDGGPVFFLQERLGKDAMPFKIWKFRSMIVDADRYLETNGMPANNRITRVGKILRRYSLDELPQLLNIIKGDMSLVGPRPVLRGHYARYTDAQRERFFFKPGITGLAQISGRNDISWSRRIELDNQYISNFSLALDFKIVLRTAAQLLTSRVTSLDRNSDAVDDLGPPR